MKFGVVVFPGSNCDHDAFHAIGHVLQKPVEFIWHQSEDLHQSDAIILPGGFSYGDYLRTGAIARFSPVMKAVERFANQGGLVLGICNGFQILLEAGLLPGAMVRNSGLRFICKHVHVRVEETNSPFTGATKRYSRTWRRITRSCSATPRAADGTTRPETPTGRRPISPGSATRRGM